MCSVRRHNWNDRDSIYVMNRSGFGPLYSEKLVGV